MKFRVETDVPRIERGHSIGALAPLSTPFEGYAPPIGAAFVAYAAPEQCMA
jgi:hypothetical protein